MKKFTKIALISALILVVIGGILIGTGLAFGATKESFTEDTRANRFLQNWMHRIASWDEQEDWEYDNRDIQDDRDEYDNRDIQDDRNEYDNRDTQDDRNEYDNWDEHDNWDNHEGMNKHNNKNHYKMVGNGFENIHDGGVIAADEVEVLKLEILAGEVEIKMVSGSEIRISGVHKLDSVSYDADEGELDIFREVKHHNADGKMVIEIPQNKVFQEMDLSVSAGELKAAGKLSAKECSITMTAGNLEAELLDCQETDIECSAGNVSVRHTGKLEDYLVDVEDNMGNMTLNGKHHAGFHEGVIGKKDSSRSIDVECDAGNVEIKFENQ